MRRETQWRIRSVFFFRMTLFKSRYQCEICPKFYRAACSSTYIIKQPVVAIGVEVRAAVRRLLCYPFDKLLKKSPIVAA